VSDGIAWDVSDTNVGVHLGIEIFVPLAFDSDVRICDSIVGEVVGVDCGSGFLRQLQEREWFGGLDDEGFAVFEFAGGELDLWGSALVIANLRWESQHVRRVWPGHGYLRFSRA
jgi:hypothetical protein